MRCKGFISNEVWEIKVDSDDSGDSDPRGSGLIGFRVTQAIQIIQGILIRRTQWLQWGLGDSNFAASGDFMDLDLAESLVSGRFSEVLTDSKDSCESDAGLK